MEAGRSGPATTARRSDTRSRTAINNKGVRRIRMGGRQKRSKSQGVSPCLSGPQATKLGGSGAFRSPNQSDVDTIGDPTANDYRYWSTAAHQGRTVAGVKSHCTDWGPTSRFSWRSARHTASAKQRPPMEHRRSPDDQHTPEDCIEEVTTQRMATDPRSKAARSDRKSSPVQRPDDGAPLAQATTPRRRLMTTPSRLAFFTLLLVGTLVLCFS